jgi:hypothetical protein
MCGLAGWVSYGGDLKSHQDVITTMTKTMARPLGTTSSLLERAGLERARSISAWVKDYGVVLGL